MRWAFSKCTLELLAMLMEWRHSTQSAKSRLLSLPPPGNFINKSLDLFQEEFQGFCVCVFPETQQFYMLHGVQTPKRFLGTDGGPARQQGHGAGVGPRQQVRPDVSSSPAGRPERSLRSGSSNLARRRPVSPRFRLPSPLPHSLALAVFSTRFLQSAGVLK